MLASCHQLCRVPARPQIEDQQLVTQPKWSTWWSHSWLSALHCLQQLQSRGSSTSSTQPWSHWSRPSQRHQVPRPTLSRRSVSMSVLLRQASPEMSTQRLRPFALLFLLAPPPRLPHTTLPPLTPPRNSRSRSFCSSVLLNTPFGARSHFGCMKTSMMHIAPVTAATRGRPHLLMPPRSSPLPSFSNSASSLKPYRRALSHFPNPGTPVLSTVSAAPAAAVDPFQSLVRSLTAHHLRLQDSRNRHSWVFHTTSILKLRPCVPFHTMAPALPRQARRLHLLHRLPYSRRSEPPWWEHIPLVHQLHHKRSAGTALAETHSAIGADPRAGRGPFPKTRPVVLPKVRFGLPKPAGLGHLHNADSDLVHHQYRLSILQWNPRPARRTPTQIIAATCGVYHAVILQEASDHVLHVSDQFIAYTGTTDLTILLNKDTFEPNPEVCAFQEASSSKDTWGRVLLVVRGLVRRPFLFWHSHSHVLLRPHPQCRGQET